MIFAGNEEIWPKLAQYEMHSLDALWPRLKLLPPGTTLTLVSSSGPNQAHHAAQITAEIEKRAADLGLSVTVKSED